MSGIIPGASPLPTSSSLDGHDTNWLNEVDGNFLAFLRLSGRFAPMAMAASAVMMTMLAPGWLLNGTTRTEVGTWTTGTVTAASASIASVGRTGGIAQGQLIQAWGFVSVSGVNTWTPLFPSGTYVKTITSGAMGAGSLTLSQNALSTPAVSLAVGNAWIVIGPGVGCVANGNSHSNTTLDGFDTGVLNNVFPGMTVTGGDAPANATVNTVNVAGGSITINGGSATGTHSGLAYTFGVPKTAANPRLDLISVDGTTGALTWTKGTEAANPSAPSVPSNGLPAAELYVTTSTTALTAQSNIIDCRALSSGSPVVQLMGGTFRNLKCSYPGSAKTGTITADAVVVTTASDVQARVIESLNVTLDISTNGAVNKLDTGSAASSTLYYLWAISNGSTDGVLASTSSTSPTMPSGYTYKARIGAFFTDGSANIVAGVQLGRTFQYTTPQLLSSGPVGSNGVTSAPTWAATSLTGFVPPTAAKYNFIGANRYNGAAGVHTVIAAPNNSYSYVTSANPPPFYLDAGGGVLMAGAGSFVLESMTMYLILAGSATNAILISGWEDNL